MVIEKIMPEKKGVKFDIDMFIRKLRIGIEDTLLKYPPILNEQTDSAVFVKIREDLETTLSRGVSKHLQYFNRISDINPDYILPIQEIIPKYIDIVTVLQRKKREYEKTRLESFGKSATGIAFAAYGVLELFYQWQYGISFTKNLIQGGEEFSKYVSTLFFTELGAALLTTFFYMALDGMFSIQSKLVRGSPREARNQFLTGRREILDKIGQAYETIAKDYTQNAKT